jgi:hypothetical protein
MIVEVTKAKGPMATPKVSSVNVEVNAVVVAGPEEEATPLKEEVEEANATDATEIGTEMIANVQLEGKHAVHVARITILPYAAVPKRM